MKILTTIILTAITLGLTAPSAFGDRGGERIIRNIVIGSGTGADTNRESAESQAYDQAQTNANMYCSMGMIEDGNYEKTADGCITQGDSNNGSDVTYLCTVTVKAVCVIHY